MRPIDDDVTDPVCGMKIPRTDAIQIVHDRIMYHFCEAVCADIFREDPPRWADGFERRAHPIKRRSLSRGPHSSHASN
jgi:YHS domain-containing protein